MMCDTSADCMLNSMPYLGKVTVSSNVRTADLFVEETARFEYIVGGQ